MASQLSIPDGRSGLFSLLLIPGVVLVAVEHSGRRRRTAGTDGSTAAEGPEPAR